MITGAGRDHVPVDIIRLLVEHGASLSIHSNDCYFPLNYCFAHNVPNPDVIKLLIPDDLLHVLNCNIDFFITCRSKDIDNRLQVLKFLVQYLPPVHLTSFSIMANHYNQTCGTYIYINDRYMHVPWSMDLLQGSLEKILKRTHYLLQETCLPIAHPVPIQGYYEETKFTGRFRTMVKSLQTSVPSLSKLQLYLLSDSILSSITVSKASGKLGLPGLLLKLLTWEPLAEELNHMWHCPKKIETDGVRFDY